MKTLMLLALVLSTSAFAGPDCLRSVEASFKKSYPKYDLRLIKPNGKILPKTDRPYLQEEIWNESDVTLDIYEIQSSFMAKFVHVALVDGKSCEVKNMMEVFFE
jgi:hypothetical protein